MASFPALPCPSRSAVDPLPRHQRQLLHHVRLQLEVQLAVQFIDHDVTSLRQRHLRILHPALALEHLAEDRRVVRRHLRVGARHFEHVLRRRGWGVLFLRVLDVRAPDFVSCAHSFFLSIPAASNCVRLMKSWFSATPRSSSSMLNRSYPIVALLMICPSLRFGYRSISISRFLRVCARIAGLRRASALLLKLIVGVSVVLVPLANQLLVM